MDVDLDGKEKTDHFNPLAAANAITNSSQSLLNPYGMPSEGRYSQTLTGLSFMIVLGES